jgi:rhodanese-related sulfurtransferase
MGTLNEILSQAQQRARENNLPYAGALLPSEAQKLRESVTQAQLVDVRSRPELELVGRIPGATHIEWAFYPDMRPNLDFLAQLDQQIDREALVMFICRTGGRSHNAAATATQAGYTNCYNVLEGFEGATDAATGQRGKINGWKMAGLPWIS